MNPALPAHTEPIPVVPSPSAPEPQPPPPPPPTTTTVTTDTRGGRDRSTLHKLWALITYTPHRCRYDPNQPPEFSLPLNLLFAFAATFTVANLYYIYPLLVVLSHDFRVDYERIAVVPTVMQAGYAVGILFLCPLGDLLRRRAFVLSLVAFTATVWVGLCVTRSFEVFAAMSFLCSISTVTPQLMLPLVGDLAPPARRAACISIVVSGLMLGVLIARVLSGTIAKFVGWRIIYWIAFGLQYLILILLWLFMPDYPSTNPGGLEYHHMLWSIPKLVGRNPILAQTCLIGFCSMTTFTSFWTTLTFLLAAPPYNYNSFIIGLFSFIGIAAMLIGPFYGRYIIDRFVPLFSIIIGDLICLTGVAIGTYIGTFTVAGPIIQALLIDLGLQGILVANRSAIYSIEPKARNRVNAAYMVSAFCGQMVGTFGGAKLYSHGGWIASGSVSIGFLGLALLVCLARGPWEEGWVGWRGGYSIRRRDLDPIGTPAEDPEGGLEKD